MGISIIVPCYNEEAALPYFYKEICNLRKNSALKAPITELIFIDDGSRDKTLDIIKALAKTDNTVKYISFSRNFGKESAIYAGLEASTGDYVAIMDADLQDPPPLLLEMYSAIISEGYDCVATRRVTRTGEPPIRSFFARLFYRIMNKISKTELVDGARDYRLMNRKFVNSILCLKEYNRFSKGLFGWVGFKTKWLAYENTTRVAGETKWSFGKLFIYAVDGIVAFSTFPLVIATFLGMLIGIFAALFLAIIIIRKIIWGDPIQGWASIVSIQLFLGSIQLLSLGIIGQYLSKLYVESKGRPIYIANETNIK